MSEKKIVIPDGMRKACGLASDGVDPELLSYPLYSVVEAALKWLSDNPIIPTEEDIEEMGKILPPTYGFNQWGSEVAAEWQRRMFYIPNEPIAVRDLLWDSNPYRNIGSQARHDKAVMEAYRRGKAEAEKGS